jgi:hypothetical protein
VLLASLLEINEMIWRIVRSRGVIPIVLILGGLLYWKLHTGQAKAISVGYVGDRGVLLWNTLAEVRESIGELHYGDRVEVLRAEGPAVQVRTASGTVGWMRDSHQLMDSDLWGKIASLLDRARTLPIQARGRTKTVSNVRAEPGRDGKRIFQFGRDTKILILERAVADAPSGPEENSQPEKTAAQDQQKTKQEDWLLVMRAPNSRPIATAATSMGSVPPEVPRATTDSVSSGPSLTEAGPATVAEPAGPVAGWVLARFIDIDLPDAVKDYASSADLHVVAWFELNRVANGSGGESPQYLVVGSRGVEGSPCDFNMLRVYTWSVARKRYETAYVESDLCGRLPIQVSTGAKGTEFQFPDVDQGGAKRKYAMFQTSVRLIKDRTAQETHDHH